MRLIGLGEKTNCMNYDELHELGQISRIKGLCEQWMRMKFDQQGASNVLYREEILQGIL